MNPREILRQQNDAALHGALSIWTIYDHPRDYPDGFSARRFESGPGGVVATSDTLTGTLEDLREMLWKAGLLKLTREEGDAPQIVESWV